MDSELDDFTRQVLDWRHTHIPMHTVVRVARHLRDVVQPQLAELATLRARVAELEADPAAKRKKAASVA